MGKRNGENKAERANHVPRPHPEKRAPRRDTETILEEKVGKLLKALRKGRDLIRAARYARLKLAVVTKMLEEDEDFAAQVDEAVDHFEDKHVKHIENQAEDDWRGSAWILERRFRHWAAPETQAKSSQVGVTSGELRKAILDGLKELGESHKGITREEFENKHPDKS